MGARRAAFVALTVALAACTPRRDGRRRAGNLKTAIRPARVGPIGASAFALVFDVEFDNDSTHTLTVTAIDYGVRFATRPWRDYQPWAQGEAAHGRTIEPRTDAVITVAVPVPFERLRQTFPRVAREPQLGYIIRAKVHLDLGSGSTATVPLRGQSLVAVPRVPSVVLDRLEGRRLDADAARLDLIVRVANPNAVRATIKKLGGTVTLAGTPVATVGLTPNQTVHPGQRAELTVPLPLDFRRHGAALRQAIASGSVGVRLNGTATVLTPYDEHTLSLDLTRTVEVRR
jgi:LEA14-like dessication related protein